MKPILLIHGYSAEGKESDDEAERHARILEIYGTLPEELRTAYGDETVVEIDLSRWISLEDGIAIDDIAFALDRALRSDRYRHLLESGFHVIIHSTGALVVRTWVRQYSPTPSPIGNLVHLAGANFGSGLAHIGKGTAARWGRQIFAGTEAGVKVLRELEFGADKTIDLHLALLGNGNRMLEEFGIQEFCIIGSQIPPNFRLIPVRYIKEDSSDCTVRTAAGNLNFNYLRIAPTQESRDLDFAEVNRQVEARFNWQATSEAHYQLQHFSPAASDGRVPIPFAIPFETAHLGSEIGIVSGAENREEVIPLVRQALETAENDPDAYAQTAEAFAKHTAITFERAAGLRKRLLSDPRAQYEGHAQVVFRLKDQYGRPVEHYDIYFDSVMERGLTTLESCIEDKHQNGSDPGSITYYLRLQQCSKQAFVNLLDSVAPLHLEITGHEPDSGEIAYLPLRFMLEPEFLRRIVQPLRTTVVDITLLRLPSGKVFHLEPHP